MTHCWEDGNERTCLLPDGHDGPHEWTPDAEILIQFAAPPTEGGDNHE